MYNVETFIGQAIESILSQSISEWELIIVNDGSKDSSLDIAKRYVSKDCRIRILNKQNGGLSDARNYGLEATEGQYVHFFDSDDWVSSDFYEQMLDSIPPQSDPDIIIGGYVVETFDNKKHWSTERRPNTDIQDPKELSNLLSGFLNFAWNKLFKREFLIEHKLTYEKGLKLIEDCEFMSRVVDYNPKIKYSQAIGYHYRNDNRPTLSKFFDNSLIELSERRIKSSRKILSFIHTQKSFIEQSLNIVRINTIRFLIHSLFAFTHNIPIWKKYETIKRILGTTELKITKQVNGLTSVSDRITSLLITHRATLLLTILYFAKERK
ncbi:MAG: glycosyltransferase [Bacteroidales bacterium]|nr:glycosyltransferase [Bacteroidales bacterium]